MILETRQNGKLSPSAAVAGRLKGPEHARARRPDHPLVVVTGRIPETRQMMRMLLELWDFDVAEAAGVDDSVLIAEADRPAAVLIDGYLPMKDCLAEVEAMKRYKCMKDVPLILLSGFSRERAANAAAQSGADGLMVKPLDFDALERLLKYFAGKG